MHMVSLYVDTWYPYSCALHCAAVWCLHIVLYSVDSMLLGENSSIMWHIVDYGGRGALYATKVLN